MPRYITLSLVILALAGCSQESAPPDVASRPAPAPERGAAPITTSLVEGPAVGASPAPRFAEAAPPAVEERPAAGGAFVPQDEPSELATTEPATTEPPVPPPAPVSASTAPPFATAPLRSVTPAVEAPAEEDQFMANPLRRAGVARAGSGFQLRSLSSPPAESDPEPELPAAAAVTPSPTAQDDATESAPADPVGSGAPPVAPPASETGAEETEQRIHDELESRRVERRAAIEAVLAARADSSGAGMPAPGAAASATAVPATPTHNELFPIAEDGSEKIPVFYATDRKAERETPDTLRTIVLRFAPAAAVALFTLALGAVAMATQRRLAWLLTVATGAIAMVMVAFAVLSTWHTETVIAQGGLEYGNERGDLQLGICQVSIPPHHEPGQLEGPSVTRLEINEDSLKHVILENIKPLQDDDFYKQLQERVARSPQKEVFIFIHGYNNTFEDAIRRTGQMAHDLEYAGAAVCYSWPSQGGMLQYTVDETNVAWTTPHFKRFVLDVVARSNARSVSLVAHSMGNRAMTCAIRDIALEMKDAPPLFQQLILAAPDIDADVFVRDIAPVLTQKAKSVTLYASSNDHALIASKLVHGYPRAGDSGEWLVLIPGIDTIDVSDVDTSLIGHNYYGESDAILADICLLLQGSKPPSQRSWLTPMAQNGLTYWVLQSAQAAAWARSRVHTR